MKNLLYSLILFVSFGTVLSTSLMANPNQPNPISVQDRAPFSHRNNQYYTQQREVDTSCSANPEQQILDQLKCYAERNSQYCKEEEINILCAKINEAGQFGEKIKLIPIKLKTINGSLKDFVQQVQSTQDKTIVFLNVNRNSTHKPYFFSQIVFWTPDGKANICKANYFQDTNICNAMNGNYLGGSGPQQKKHYESINLGEAKQERQNEHQNNNLGEEGQGWQNEHRIGIWKEFWKRQRVIFIIKYGNQILIAVPTKQSNKAIANITPDKWNTPLSQKILLGADATARIAGAGTTAGIAGTGAVAGIAGVSAAARIAAAAAAAAEAVAAAAAAAY
jgi:hypothetical protein